MGSSEKRLNNWKGGIQSGCRRSSCVCDVRRWERLGKVCEGCQKTLSFGRSKLSVALHFVRETFKGLQVGANVAATVGQNQEETSSYALVNLGFDQTAQAVGGSSAH